MLPHSVHFLLGYSRGEFAAQARVVEIHPGPDYDPARQVGTRLGSDWALLYLDRALGTPDRVLPLDVSPPQVGTELLLAGYEQDRAEILEADLHCSVQGFPLDARRHALFEHNCAATRGSSGAPLIARRDGRWVALGIQLAVAQGKSLGIAVSAVNIGLAELRPAAAGH